MDLLCDQAWRHCAAAQVTAPIPSGLGAGRDPTPSNYKIIIFIDIIYLAYRVWL